MSTPDQPGSEPLGSGGPAEDEAEAAGNPDEADGAPDADPDTADEGSAAGMNAETAEDGAETDEGSADPLEAAEIEIDRQAIRRAPRFGRFAFLGGLLGFVAGFAASPFARYDQPGAALDPWGLGLLLALILAPVGILLGCLVALMLDRRSRRKVSR
ncbi:MAG: hypothetical protein ACK5H2_04170 [Beutenbergiaceae bacterium]